MGATQPSTFLTMEHTIFVFALGISFFVYLFLVGQPVSHLIALAAMLVIWLITIIAPAGVDRSDAFGFVAVGYIAGLSSGCLIGVFVKGLLKK